MQYLIDASVYVFRAYYSMPDDMVDDQGKDGAVPGRRFRDTQVEGPFARWIHTHSFEPDGDGAILEDRIDWSLPGGAIANALLGGFVRRKLRRMFEYRHGVIAEAFGAGRNA